MGLLEEFIRLEIEEGPKLNAAFIAAGLAGGAALKNFEDDGDQPRYTYTKHNSSTPADDFERELWDAVDEVPDEASKPEEKKKDVPEYSKKKLLSFVQRAADKHNVPPAFVDAIIRTESNYDPSVVSHAGAEGIMQIMPATAKGLGLKNSFDAKEAIDKGTMHLRQLLDQFDDDYELAAAGYNAGAGAVTKYGGVPPYKETQAYVARVKERMEASRFAPVETATTTASLE